MAPLEKQHSLAVSAGADRDVKAAIARTARAVEAGIEADLADWLGGVPPRLAEAIRYAMTGGGKRLRPVLVLWSAEVCGGGPARCSRLDEDAGGGEPAAVAAMPAAVAVEMLHTYSLVHDDLPAMDDDDLRRGRATCHKVYGEGLAILVGDALLTRAFETLARADLPARRAAALLRCLAEAGGAAGMIGGQAEDLAWQCRASDLATVEAIHARKTAALFAAACRMGAIAAGAGAAVQRTLHQAGHCLGMAFQIADDLLDEVGQTEQLGKRAGKDRSAGKLTYVSVAGVEASRRAAGDWAERARRALADLGGGPGGRRDDLAALSRYVVDRTS